MYRGELARCADLLAYQLGKETLGKHWKAVNGLMCGAAALRKDYHNMLDWMSAPLLRNSSPLRLQEGA